MSLPDIVNKTEIQQIAAFLNDVYEGICEGDEEAAMRLHLTELYRVIKRLMDATFATEDRSLKVLLAGARTSPGQRICSPSSCDK